MKRSVYFAFPIVAILVLLISGFGILPRSTQLPVEATPTTTLLPRLGTPVQTPQSRIFTSCPPGGEGRVVTNFQDLKNLSKKDYAKELSPESLARYVATLSDTEREAYLKTLDSEQLVKYVAGLAIKDRENYLKTLKSTSRKEFEADLAEYQQGELYQNELKNRTDGGDYKSMKFQDLLNLPPTASDIRSQLNANLHWKNRGSWEQWQKDLIYRYEGLAIKVDGYIYSTEPQGTETTNCGISTGNMKDWHVLFMEQKDYRDRGKSVVVELTPRIRNIHQEWTLDVMKVVRNKYRVRISGWLFFDPEHPANLPDPARSYLGTRGTLWEIHPVMRIFVKLIDNDDRSPWYALETCRINSTKTELLCNTPDSSEPHKIIK